MSPAELKVLQRKLESLVDQGLIMPYAIPWGSIALYVRKKDGYSRLCIEYRVLNRLSLKESHPLPKIDRILDHILEENYFTKVDLRYWFHQILLTEESVQLIAFNKIFNHY